jgi:hypothetical protein
VGGTAAALIGGQVMAAPVPHTDDTPIVVLAPGNGKTRTGRLWTYVVDERPWQGGRSPAAYYRFSPGRRGERPRDHPLGGAAALRRRRQAGDRQQSRRAGTAHHRRHRKNFLFLGSEAGVERAAILYTVLESAWLNGLDPEGYLADVIARLAQGHPINRLNELLPWNWQRQPARMAA